MRRFAPLFVVTGLAGCVTEKTVDQMSYTEQVALIDVLR